MQPLVEGSYRSVAGRLYRTPKEVWGFRSERGTGTPVQVARQFLRANAALFGLRGILRDVRKPRVIHSLGANHVIQQQHLLGLRIHRAYVTVHVARDGRVFLAKNRAVPAGLLPARREGRVREQAAIAAAARSVRAGRRKYRVSEQPEAMWFPRGRRVLPVWRVRLHKWDPREEWIVHVDARTARLVDRYDNLALARGRGRIFDPNPVVALGDHRQLMRTRTSVHEPPPRAYRTVTLHDLEPSGYLDGPRVSTRATCRRVRRRDRRFLFEAWEQGFEEVMVYHHIDRALRYVESLGYRGERAIFREPVVVDVNGSEEDNSWFSPGEKTLTFGTGGVHDAEDADTILHELGHALQDAICPDFGRSEEAAAMGEGFGDYLAVSFTSPAKRTRRQRRYLACVMSWNGLTDDNGTDPPCVRRVDEELTWEDFVSGPDAEEHDNGRIWAALLWDVFKALGKRAADKVVIESHFQLDGYTTFARGARALLDADRNLYRGRHARALRLIFERRGLALD